MASSDAKLILVNFTEKNFQTAGRFTFMQCEIKLIRIIKVNN